MDYRTELIKTQFPVTSKSPNDPAASAEATAGPVRLWESGLGLFGLNGESMRRTRVLKKPPCISPHNQLQPRSRADFLTVAASVATETFVFNQQQHLSAWWLITIQSSTL